MVTRQRLVALTAVLAAGFFAAASAEAKVTQLLTPGVVMSAAAAEPSARSDTGWVVRELGVQVILDGGGDSELYVGTGDSDPAVNEQGMVAGTIQRASGSTRAFVWYRGKLTRLGPLPGDTKSKFVALNDRGQVLGLSGGSFYDHRYGHANPHAFLWENGRMRKLGSFLPRDINEHGEVVGTVTRGRTRAVLWSGGHLRDLGTLPGGDASGASALNDAGQVVGWSHRADPQSRPAGHAGSIARRIAFIWQNGKMRSLGTLPGWAGSFAVDINERGQVVGILKNPNGAERPFIWQSGKIGTLDARGSLWRPEPTAINDRGQVLLNNGPRDEWAIWQAGKLRHQGPGAATSLSEGGRVSLVHNSSARIWANGKTTRLEQGAAATSLNDRGQVAGLSCILHIDFFALTSYTWDCRAVRWSARR